MILMIADALRRLADRMDPAGHERAVERDEALAVDRAPASSPAVDGDAVDRANAALCKFVFPGYAVPRALMARAALSAAADTSDDWMSRLPATLVAQGGPEPAA